MTMPISVPSARSSGRGSGLEEGDLEPAGPAHRGHLGADEPGADDHDARGLLVEVGPQDQAVVERAQDVDALEHRCPGQPSGGGPGGEHQPVEADALAAVEAHEAVGRDRGPSPAGRGR